MALDFPPIYLLKTHIPFDKLEQLENDIPTLTYDIAEAKVILGTVTTKQRAQFELRKLKLWTEEVPASAKSQKRGTSPASQESSSKRRRVAAAVKTKSQEVIIVESSTESEAESETASEADTQISKRITRSQNSRHVETQGSLPGEVFSSPPAQEESQASSQLSAENSNTFDWDGSVKVLKLDWFTDSVAAGRLLPLVSYLVYEGKVIAPPSKGTSTKQTTLAILERAKEDAPKSVSAPFVKGYGKSPHVPQHSQHSQASVTRPTHLLHQTTSEHDDPINLPPLPEWLRTVYSCERRTPLKSPNDPFMCQLKKIKQQRILTQDDIGMLAYASAIASLAAYPYTLTSVQEVLRLPKCSEKIARLYEEWRDTGNVEAANKIDSDPELKVLDLFYNIWGVGAPTARQFYDKGWRDLDDIVEFGWASLSRVQQIGVKYYDEIATKIPRAEVEHIGSVILGVANKLHPDCQLVIVGGYRRGKAESGDVDVVLTHPEEHVTHNLVHDVVAKLEEAAWITHTLTISSANSDRGQTPVKMKGDSGHKGSGFDTLDKALVMWQDPNWATKEKDLAENPKAKNPNIHRRVDIIVSPWKTAGCAILGWSGGTQFERDLRKYAKQFKDWKFDSSGIRSHADGSWQDVESVGGKAPDLLTAEKRVFEGLGLEWREPTERCTG